MISFSENDTTKIAAEFAQTLRGGELIFLFGDLGAGKTTFVRGAVEALGSREPVRSPTFALVHRHPVIHPTIREVVHADLYRLMFPQELLGLALEEDTQRKDAVVFVEWPDRGEGLLGIPTHEFIFELREHARVITLLPRRHAALHPQT